MCSERAAALPENCTTAASTYPPAVFTSTRLATSLLAFTAYTHLRGFMGASYLKFSRGMGFRVRNESPFGPELNLPTKRQRDRGVRCGQSTSSWAALAGGQMV